MEPPASPLRVSILVPVFNGERHLEQTLKSILAQRFEDFEVLLGDDFSVDGSPEILARFVAADPRFRAFRTPRNLGMAPRVLNFLLPHVRSSLLLYISQDDIFSDDWLLELVSRHDATNADAVLPIVEFFCENGRTNKRQIGYRGDLDAQIPGTTAFLASLEWEVTGFALWPTDLVRRIGYSDFAINGDEYTVRRLFLNCRTVAFSRGVYFYRQDNPDAITRRLSIGTMRTPITSLHLWQLLREAGFPLALGDAELTRSASGLLWQLRRLLGPEGRTALTRHQRIEATRVLLCTGRTILESEARPDLVRLIFDSTLKTRAKIASALAIGYIAKVAGIAPHPDTP